MIRIFSVFSIGLILLASCAAPAPKKAEQPDRLTDFVDPFIGTGDHGHTYPGAAFPFGRAFACAALAFADLGDGFLVWDATSNFENLRGAMTIEQARGIEVSRNA